MSIKIWNADKPKDLPRISKNIHGLLEDFNNIPRSQILQSQLLAWHSRIYMGCQVPNDNYLGQFRGDPIDPDLEQYRIRVGNSKEGVWPEMVQQSMDELFIRLNTSFAYLDGFIPDLAQSADQVAEVLRLTGLAHGELIRIHPFVNGNGRIARLLANYISLRYGIPAFVAIKPRPMGVTYVAAAEKSLGHPPKFQGDHTATIAVFHNMLAELLKENG